ncbi:MAG: polyprenyl synthetase family protein [Pseudomonadota bacterium]|nr:polyprenyl synthetase family protein [Pseudomonadota bacterium]
MYPIKFSDQEFIAWCESHKKLLHHTMECKLDLAKLPLGLSEAISYAVFSPGKRLRPLLCFATGHSLQIEPEKTVEIATALEYMHAYSLVHDDLPGMDNDTYRRSLPTTHIAYDHATAILVGDALQALAYETILSSAHLSDVEKMACLNTLNRASGAGGMVSGQYLDWQKQQNFPLAQNDIANIHRLKTGLCLQAALTMPLHLKDIPLDSHYLSLVGELLGIAYQYLDDIDDQELHGTLDNLDCPASCSPPKYFATALEKAQWLHSQAIKNLQQHGLDCSTIIVRMVNLTLAASSTSQTRAVL